MNTGQINDETIRASTRATPAMKRAAREIANRIDAEFAPFAFNAVLNVWARGERATVANIRDESQRIARANDVQFMAYVIGGALR